VGKLFQQMQKKVVDVLFLCGTITVRIQKIVKIDLDDIIGGNIETFNDMANEQAAPDKILSDISYKIVGFGPQTLHIEVDAEVNEV
jgi:hypothetical protein